MDFPSPSKANAQILIFSICFFLHKSRPTCNGYFTRQYVIIAHPLVDAFQTCIKLITFVETVFVFAVLCFSSISSEARRVFLYNLLCVLWLLQTTVFLCHCSKTDGVQKAKDFNKNNRIFLIDYGEMISILLCFFLEFVDGIAFTIWS